MLHFTFDEYEATLEKMMKHVDNEIAYSDTDKQYYDDQTKDEMLKIKYHLASAYNLVSAMMKRVYDSQ